MGLSLKAVYEKGSVIPGSALQVNVLDYTNKLIQAYNNAFQIAIQATYITPSTASSIISIVFQNAKKVAVEAGYLTKETTSDLIVKVNAQAQNLKGKIDKLQK